MLDEIGVSYRVYHSAHYNINICTVRHRRLDVNAVRVLYLLAKDRPMEAKRRQHTKSIAFHDSEGLKGLERRLRAPFTLYYSGAEAAQCDYYQQILPYTDISHFVILRSQQFAWDTQTYTFIKDRVCTVYARRSERYMEMYVYKTLNILVDNK